MHVFLAVAAILMLVAIAVQDYLYPPLRQQTISEGLTGPYHVVLDSGYAILAAAIALAFRPENIPADILGFTASAMLVVTAVANTGHAFVDKISGGNHDKIHTYGTVVLFLAVFALEVIYGWPWLVANLAFPAFIYGLSLALPQAKVSGGAAAEKAAVLVMCAWLTWWAVGR